MRVRLADADLLDDLVRHLRATGFLVARVDREAIQGHPLSNVGERYNRRRLRQELDRWLDGHPEAAPTID